MIPSYLSLVPENHARRAAMLAVADVENKRTRDCRLPEYPYAHAFFRYLRGSKRVAIHELRLFSPSLSEQELRGNKASWMSAVDALIESRGVNCYLPLPIEAGQEMFPEVVFQRTERQRRQDELDSAKYTRQRSREEGLRERDYQALAGQAEIDLAFHTPETVSSWASRWSSSGLQQFDLESMFFRWSERFPSLKDLDRLDYSGAPFWMVTLDAQKMAKGSPASLQLMERWMIPNKLTHARGVA